MADITYFSGNNSFFRQFNIFDFEPSVEIASGSGVYSYIHQQGTSVSSNQAAYRIDLHFADVVITTVNEGPDAGQPLFAGGELTQVDYFDASGTLIKQMLGMHVDAASFIGLLQNGNSTAVEALLTNGNDLIIGSDQSAVDPFARNGDDIWTGWGRDTVYGGGGGDYIRDGGGRDFYDGGDGFDSVTYNSWENNPQGLVGGIVYNAHTGRVIGPDGFTDTLVGIEEVRGTHLADKFLAKGSDLYAVGFAGDDRMVGSAASWDQVSYRFELSNGGSDGVRVDLAARKARDTFGFVDTLINIDQVIGTDLNDRMRDDMRDNSFSGLNGDDRFVFTGGNDSARGGQGADTFVYLGTDFGTDRIYDFDAAQGDKIEIRQASGMGDLVISSHDDGVSIAFSAGEVILHGRSEGEVQASWFIF